MSQGSPVTIVSTTDSSEAVQAALGSKVEAKPAGKTPIEKPATEVKAPVETVESSGAQEEAEIESEEHDESEGEESQEAKPKKKGGFQKRIDKVTKLKADAERERDYWKAEALKKADAKPAEPAKADSKVDLSKKPKAEDFEKHEDFVEALTDWKTEQKFQKRASDDRESALKTEHQKKIDAHMGRVAEFQKTHADFQEAIEDLNDVPMSLTVQEVILNAENGPELMYALAQEKEEYAKICKLPPVQAARELGRFEAKLKAAAAIVEKEEPKTTTAPKPMKPVGSKTASVKTIRDELPYEEWRKIRDAELRAQGRSTR